MMLKSADASRIFFEVQRQQAVTGAEAMTKAGAPLDTLSSNKDDRRGAAGLSKIAQMDEVRIASGRGWAKGRLTVD